MRLSFSLLPSWSPAKKSSSACSAGKLVTPPSRKLFRPPGLETEAPAWLRGLARSNKHPRKPDQLTAAPGVPPPYASSLMTVTFYIEQFGCRATQADAAAIE